jgi:hypothetical protein
MPAVHRIKELKQWPRIAKRAVEQLITTMKLKICPHALLIKVYVRKYSWREWRYSSAILNLFA